MLFYTWWRHQMETFSALQALCAGNSPVTSELPTQRPVTRRFDVFVDLRMNKRLSKHSWGWWFETPSESLQRHCNGLSKDMSDGQHTYNVCNSMCIYKMLLCSSQKTWTCSMLIYYILCLNISLETWTQIVWHQVYNMHRVLKQCENTTITNNNNNDNNYNNNNNDNNQWLVWVWVSLTHCSQWCFGFVSDVY